MGKGKREVVTGNVISQLFENNNFILRQEHKILSDHTKISTVWNWKKKKKKEMNTCVYFCFKGFHKVTNPN